MLLFFPNGGFVSTIENRAPEVAANGVHRCNRALIRVDAMQVQVHHAQAGGVVHDFPAAQRLVLQVLLLIGVELVMLGHVVIEPPEESRRCHRPGRRWCPPVLACMQSTMAAMSGARGEILAGSTLHVLGVLLKQPLIGIPLHVGVQREPTLTVNKVHDQPPQVCRVLNLVLGLAENDAEHSGLFTEPFQRLAVLRFERIAVEFDQLRPRVTLGNAAGLVERRLRPLIRHLQEQQVRQLLDVIAVAETHRRAGRCSSSRASGRFAVSGCSSPSYACVADSMCALTISVSFPRRALGHSRHFATSQSGKLQCEEFNPVDQFLGSVVRFSA